jgi:tRNA-modifying protein YgfZ
MEHKMSAETQRYYEALVRGAILPRPHYSQLRLTGADRVDFLQRMTTNNIAALRPGQAAVTVLTSSTARVQFVFTVLCREEDLILLPGGPNQIAALAKHLRGQIFFMDNVTVHTDIVHTDIDTGKAESADSNSETSDLIRMRLVGSEAQARLAAWQGLPDDLADGAFLVQADTLILRQDGFDLPGYELLVPAGQAGEVVLALEAAGFVLVEGVGEEGFADANTAYTARRIELGRPATGTELTEDYNPLEVGLGWTCAENKGCYTGQEIIARQVTYDKITRSLVGLQSDTPLAPGTDITLPEGNRAVGKITSAAYSPTLQSYVALAVIRRPHSNAGESVWAEAASGTTVEMQVQELPLITIPAFAGEHGA